VVQENKRKENATYFSRKFSKKMLPKTDGRQLNTRVGEFDVIIYKIKTLKVSLAIIFVILSSSSKCSFFFLTPDIKARIF